MMKEILSATDFIGKEILELTNGDLAGTIDTLLLAGSPLTVQAAAYTGPDGQKGICDISMLTDIDQRVVVMRQLAPFEAEGRRDILTLACADKNGHLLGSVEGFSFNSASKALTKIVVASAAGSYAVDASLIAKIGTGAVLLGADDSELQKAYIEKEEEDAASAKEMTAEELFQTVGKRMSESVSEISQKVGEKVKNIDTDNLSSEFNRFTENVNSEITKLMDNVLGQFSSRRYNAYDAEVQSILRDLHNYTVERPVNDRQGEAIIIPGQVITEEKIRTVIDNDKIAELYRVAVPIEDGETHE